MVHEKVPTGSELGGLAPSSLSARPPTLSAERARRGQKREGLRSPRLAQLPPVPGPLLTPARPTQSLEPILVPRLRIQLADFPYLHCSID